MSDPGVNTFNRAGRLHAVRPEHLYLDAAGADDVSFPAQLLSRETNGSETFLHCEVENTHWVVRLDGLINPGDPGPVTLFAAPEAIYDFGSVALG